MIGFVQRLDKATGHYLKINGEGDVIAEQAQRFMAPDGKPIEEIEPIEIERPRAKMSDPLGDMR
jgi:hypothetical protein